MRRILTLAVTALAALINIEAAQTIKAPKGGKAISDELLGIFFEDISYAADGLQNVTDGGLALRGASFDLVIH